MRLAQGIILENKETFGIIKFSDLRREQKIIDSETGEVTEEVKERTYDLKSSAQGCMIQVSIPASAGIKKFEYNSEVELINPIADTVSSANYRGADVNWYIKADDIVLVKNNKSNIQKPN